MSFRRRLLVSLLISLPFTGAVNAQAAEESGPDFWGGSGSFGSLQLRSDMDHETTKNGVMGGAKLLFVWQQEHHRYDLGIGANVNSAKGETQERRQAITQIGALIDLTYAYRVAKIFDLGLTLHSESGKGSHLEFDKGEKFRVWAGGGPTARFHFDFDSFLIDVGASYLIDFSVPKRTQIKTPIFANFLFPLRERVKPVVAAAPKPAPVAQPAPTPVPPSKEVPPPVQPNGDIAAGHVAEFISDNQVKVVLPTSRVLFATGKATVGAEGDAYLKRLGEILRNFDASILVVDVSGHTDKRGSVALNNRLSKDRAGTVRAALIRGGTNPGKIMSRGAGSSEPRREGDSEDDLAANRRVEVTLKVASRARELVIAINLVDKEFKK